MQPKFIILIHRIGMNKNYPIFMLCKITLSHFPAQTHTLKIFGVKRENSNQFYLLFLTSMKEYINRGNMHMHERKRKILQW